MTFNDDAAAQRALFKPTHRLKMSRALHGHERGDIVDVVPVRSGIGGDYSDRNGNWINVTDADYVRQSIGLRIAPSGQIETGVKDTNPKDAVGSRKLPWHVIPWRVLAGVVLAFFGGALKYRAFNYRIAGVRASVYVDAAFRHIARFWEGEDWDPDVKGYNKEDPSKGVLVHHLDEAIAGLMVLRDSMLLGNWTDDRPPSVSPSWIDEANDMAGRIIDANPDPKRDWTQAEVVKARAVAAAVTAYDDSRVAPVSVVNRAGGIGSVSAPAEAFVPTHDTEPGDHIADWENDGGAVTLTHTTIGREPMEVVVTPSTVEHRPTSDMPDLTGVDWNGNKDPKAPMESTPTVRKRPYEGWFSPVDED